MDENPYNGHRDVNVMDDNPYNGHRHENKTVISVISVIRFTFVNHADL